MNIAPPPPIIDLPTPLGTVRCNTCAHWRQCYALAKPDPTLISSFTLEVTKKRKTTG